jgi:hypothetical protein
MLREKALLAQPPAAEAAIAEICAFYLPQLAPENLLYRQAYQFPFRI